MASNQRLNAIMTVGATMAGSVRTTMRGVAGRLQEVNSEIGQITRRQRELERQRTVWQQQGRDVDALDRELNDLNGTLDTLRRRQERLRGISRGLDNVGSAARGAFSTVATQAAAAGAAIGLVGTAMVGLANGTATAARDVERFARNANASNEEFQRMAFAAESVGINQEKMGDILKDVNDRIGDFLQTGGGPMADFFENIAPQVGVTAEQFRHLSGPQALQLFASSLEQAGLSQQEMTFYMEAMASDATALIPLLRDNGAEMNRLGDRAAAVGRVLSDEAIAASNEYHQSMSELRGSMEGVRNTIGTALIPVIGELAQSFTNFVVENRPMIQEFATNIATGFRDALPAIGEIVNGLIQVGGVIADVVRFSADLLGGWENLGMAVGAAFVAPSILAIGRLGAAIGGLILATGPVGMVIAGVAAAAGLIIANWDTIKDAAVAAWEVIKTGFGTAIDWIGEKVAWLAGNGFLGPVGLIIAHWESIGEAGQAAWNGLVAGGQAAVDWVVEKFEWMADRVNELLAPIREAFGWVGSQIERVSNWWNDRESGSLPASNYVNRADEFSGVPGFRRGGPMMPGAALVGEDGPELIFPSRAGYVATARQTERLMSGGGARSVNVGNITINAGPGADPRAIADEVVRVLADRERSALYDGSFA